MTRGAQHLYMKFVRPFVAKHGQSIDKRLNNVMGTVSDGQYCVTLLCDTMLRLEYYMHGHKHIALELGKIFQLVDDTARLGKRMQRVQELVVVSTLCTTHALSVDLLLSHEHQY